MKRFLGKPIVIIIASLLASLAGEFLLKYAMTASGELALDGAAGIAADMKLVFFSRMISPYIYTGIVFYSLGFFLLLVVYNRVEISVAYPMLSLNFVFTIFIARFTLGEEINVYKMGGVALIVLGVIFLSRGLPKEDDRKNTAEDHAGDER